MRAQLVGKRARGVAGVINGEDVGQGRVQARTLDGTPQVPVGILEVAVVVAALVAVAGVLGEVHRVGIFESRNLRLERYQYTITFPRPFLSCPPIPHSRVLTSLDPS
jgi:hypothetical protein